jgi:hypothetical protein
MAPRFLAWIGGVNDSHTLYTIGYAPKCVEYKFCELRLLGILGSSL